MGFAFRSRRAASILGLSTALITAIQTLTPAFAETQKYSLYVAGNLSFVHIMNSSLETKIPAVDAARPELNFDAGYGISGAIGGYMGTRWRAEVEVSYIRAKIDNMRLAGTRTPAAGSLGTISTLMNVLYDFRTGKSWRPYIGFGVGLADTKARFRALGPVPTPRRGYDTVPAFQGIVGLGYRAQSTHGPHRGL